MIRGLSGNLLFIKIAIAIVLCLSVTMCISVYLSVASASQVLESEVKEGLDKITESKKNNLKHIFSELLRVNEILSSSESAVSIVDTDAGLVNPLRAGAVTEYLSRVKQNRNDFYDNIFIEYNGAVIADGIDGKSIGFRVEKDKYSGDTVRKERRTHMGNPAPSPITGRKGFLILSPIFDPLDDARVNGVMASAIDLINVTQSVFKDESSVNNSGLIGRDLIIFLIDKNGVVIASNAVDTILDLDFAKNSELAPVFSMMNEHKTGDGRMLIDQVEFEMAFSKLEEQNFWLVSAVPVSVYAAKLSKLQTSLITVSVISSLVCTLVLTLIVFGFTSPLLRRLTKAMRSAERIAQNDLSQEVEINGSDEGTRLLTALSNMQRDLRDTIESIIQTSAQLTNMSSELSQRASHSQKEMKLQTADIEGATKAINSLSAAFEDVAHNAAAANEVCKEGATHTQMGEGNVREAILAAELLAQDLENATTSITEFTSQVEEIGSVLEVIRSIAEQTNLLALNAAIESARAGESGRGFAVVADEVRKLAHRTGESTVEIERIIRSIQSHSDNAKAGMAGCNDKAQSTVAVARHAGSALRHIASVVDRINDANGSIAMATGEQSAVARDINNNLASINRVALDILNGADDTYQSSQHLANASQKLSASVNRFKL